MSESTKNDALEAQLVAQREKLLAFIRARVPDPQAAEDILQECLLKAMGALDQLEDEEKLVAWFYQIVRNAIIDRQRRRQTEGKYLDKYAQEAELHETPEARNTVCQCFRELLPSLKDEYREMIDKMELGEGSSAEVADELGITTSNLKVRRHRARQQLKGRLQAHCGACAARGCIDCTCG